MQPTFSKRQSGFSLYGVLFALVIGMGAVAAFAALYGSIDASRKGQAEVMHLMSLANAIEAVFPDRNYSDLSNALLIKVKKVPNDMVLGPATLQNVFGGAVALSVSPTAALGGYMIEERDIPSGACVSIARAAHQRFETILVGGAFVIRPGQTYTARAAVAACKNGPVTMFFGA